MIPDHNTWKEFISHGKYQKGEVRDIILESWKLCVRLGVDPYQKKVPKVLAGKDLQKRIDDNQSLIQIALPVMENLHRFVSGSEFTIALCDQEGIILMSIGDRDITQSFAKGNFVVGADWSEAVSGTNAIGLAIKHGKAVQTTRYEHFTICGHPSTCSSAPIRDPAGKIIGILDMTGFFENAHLHTLGMVVAAAYGIEKQLESRTAWEQCNYSDRFKSAIMESISEGLLAIDSLGNITHINHFAAKILEQDPEQILGKNVSRFVRPAYSQQSTFDLSKTITDREADILIKGWKKKGMITIRAIGEPDTENTNPRKVIVLNEIGRTKKLVQRMSGAESKLSFMDILGQDNQFLTTVNLAKTAASSFSNILLLGESGTGKDIFAQAIHNAGLCAEGPFVAINCGAMPRELINSELFGYTEGAFTGAKRGGNPGKFELADGGTIFLDEIGEMPLELQSMLLRVVEQKSVMRIGGKEVIPINVRIMAATNKNLALEVEKGNFRQDLYYRLNVITLSLIPLREHMDDITILAQHFIKRMNVALNKNVKEVDERTWVRLKNYQWPGNVRELYNVLERAMNVADGYILTPETLPIELSIDTSQRSTQGDFHQMEKQLIMETLSQHEGNITQAATALGWARSTLYRKIKKYKIQV